MTYSPRELVYVCVGPGQSKPKWRLTRNMSRQHISSHWPQQNSVLLVNPGGLLHSTRHISYLYQNFWHNPEFLTHKWEKVSKEKQSKSWNIICIWTSEWRKGIWSFCCMNGITVHRVLVSNVLNTGSDNISLTPIIITILTITIRPGLDSNKTQFMTN